MKKAAKLKANKTVDSAITAITVDNLEQRRTFTELADSDLASTTGGGVYYDRNGNAYYIDAYGRRIYLADASGNHTGPRVP